MKQLKNYKAFSMVEIVVSLAVIALLLGLGTYGFSIVQRSSRDEQRKSFLSEIRSAVDHYFLVNGYYPASGDFQFSGSGDQLTVGTRQFHLVGHKKASGATDANSTKYYYEKDTYGYIICALQESGSWLEVGDGAGACQ
jgi:type II secretory pathway pseudopilin PulG